MTTNSTSSAGITIKIYLASGGYRYSKLKDVIEKSRPFILESYYYANEDLERMIPLFGDFLFDSGAFSYMVDPKRQGSIDWDEYIVGYAEFIRKHNIKKYLELDIDSLVGYPEVVRLRHKLEHLVGWKCIPVWHKSRGLAEFHKMCEEYSYVAVGGLVTKEIPPAQYSKLPTLIKIAHSHGAKIHGLGFTSLEWMKKCHFDSVDSTTWKTGGRFGFFFKFNGRGFDKTFPPENMKVKTSHSAELAKINFKEWVKFQKYALTHL